MMKAQHNKTPDLGEQLRIKRSTLKRSQQEMAAHFGVSQATYSRWESGVKQPGDVQLHRLAQLLDCAAEEIWKTIHGRRPTALEMVKCDLTGPSKHLRDMKQSPEAGADTSLLRDELVDLQRRVKALEVAPNIGDDGMRMSEDFLIGVPEIATMLGVPAETVRTWRARKVLPPAKEKRKINGGRVWDRRSIIVWAGRTRRIGAGGLTTDEANELRSEYRRRTGNEPTPYRSGIRIRRRDGRVVLLKAI